MNNGSLRRTRSLIGAAIFALLTMTCKQSSGPSPETPPRVVVYCSVDEAFAADVLTRYQSSTNVELSPVFDSEAGKTTGLVNRIIAESRGGGARADVFWSSELFNTILLARRGLLEPYAPPPAADIPDRFRDPQRRWTALAARARVIAYDPLRVAPERLPARWEDLADPRFAKQTAIANPLFGTTRGHVAAMFAEWGTDRGQAFLRRLRDGGVTIADGNSSAVRAVLSGKVAMAATDTDDVWLAQRSGAVLGVHYPDMGGGGTLLIPCSVALVKGGANTRAAKALIDYLVSAEVERMLALSESRNIPVRASLRRELRMEWPAESEVDFGAVADAMDESVAAVRETLIR